MTEDQVFQEFMQNFGDVNKDGKITKQVSFLKFLKFFKYFFFGFLYFILKLLFFEGME